MSSKVQVRFREVSDVISEIIAETNDPTGQLTAFKVGNLLRSTLDELNLWVIPSFDTIRSVTKTNGTINLPEDCIRPLAVYKIKIISGKAVLFQYGRKDAIAPPKSFSVVDEDNEEFRGADTIGNILADDEVYYVYHPEYREAFGRRDTIFYGFWVYYPEYRHIEISGTTGGDDFIIKYHKDQKQCSHIPIDAVGMVRNKVLQRYWAATDPGKAQYYFQQFRVELRMFEKFRADGYTNEDWLDAFASEYSPVNR